MTNDNRLFHFPNELGLVRNPIYQIFNAAVQNSFGKSCTAN